MNEIFKYGFTSQNVDVASEIIKKHLKAAAEEMGIGKIDVGRITYGVNEFRTKLVVSRVAAPAPPSLSGVGSLEALVGRSFKESIGSSTTYKLTEYGPAQCRIISSRYNRRRGGGTPYKIKTSILKTWILV